MIKFAKVGRQACKEDRLKNKITCMTTITITDEHQESFWDCNLVIKCHVIFGESTSNAVCLAAQTTKLHIVYVVKTAGSSQQCMN